MIPDMIFKKLQHSHKGYNMYLNGQELETGYKPDYVLKKRDSYIILESENTSSRKTFVGGLIKAAHFFQHERKGQLVFVIVPKPNTTVLAIAKHLKPYLNWVKPNTNLRDVYVVEAKTYYANEIVMSLDCDDFRECVIKV
jgi:hypothetical protein